MGVPSAEPSGSIVLSRSKTRQYLRVSLAFPLAGVATFVAPLRYTSSADQTGYSPPGTAAGEFVVLLVMGLFWVGELLILGGTIFTGVNGFLLRRRRRLA